MIDSSHSVGRYAAPAVQLPRTHGDLRHARGAEQALVVKDLSCMGVDLVLERQIGAAGVDEMDHGQTVLEGDLERTHDLVDGQRVPGSALQRAVAGDDDDLASLHDADAGDHQSPWCFAFVCRACGQRRELEER